MRKGQPEGPPRTPSTMEEFWGQMRRNPLQAPAESFGLVTAFQFWTDPDIQQDVAVYALGLLLVALGLVAMLR